jgi:hypothetical protein
MESLKKKCATIAKKNAAMALDAKINNAGCDSEQS